MQVTFSLDSNRLRSLLTEDGYIYSEEACDVILAHYDELNPYDDYDGESIAKHFFEYTDKHFDFNDDFDVESKKEFKLWKFEKTILVYVA